MGKSTTSVFVAQREGERREKLVQAFQDEAFEVVTSDDGNVLVKALHAMKHKAFVIDNDLDEVAGYDAIFLEQNAIVKNRQQSGVFVMHRVMHSQPILEFLKGCGIADFVSPDQDVDAIVRAVNDALFQKRRAARRIVMALSAVLVADGKEYSGETSDISETGIGLILSGELSLKLDSEVEIHLGFADTAFQCRAVVRGQRAQRRLLGNRTRVGVQILHAEPVAESRQTFAKLLDNYEATETRRRKAAIQAMSRYY